MNEKLGCLEPILFVNPTQNHNQFELSKTKQNETKRRIVGHFNHRSTVNFAGFSGRRR